MSGHARKKAKLKRAGLWALGRDANTSRPILPAASHVCAAMLKRTGALEDIDGFHGLTTWMAQYLAHHAGRMMIGNRVMDVVVEVMDLL